jgi:hypothetical protein
MEKNCSIGEGRASYTWMRLLVVALVCGCNHLPVTTAAASTAEPVVHEVSLPVLVVPDETMEFHVTFRGMTIANVQTAIGKPGWVDGKRAIIVRSGGRTAGIIAMLGDLRWELESTIDLDRGLPIRDHEEAWAELAGEKEHHDEHHEWSASDTYHDLHSAIGALRGWHATAKETREIRLELGGGRIQLALGPAGQGIVAGRPALRFDGVAHQQWHFSIWISDDAARVPLAAQTETELGSVAVELVDYH